MVSSMDFSEVRDSSLISPSTKKSFIPYIFHSIQIYVKLNSNSLIVWNKPSKFSKNIGWTNNTSNPL